MWFNSNGYLTSCIQAPGSGEHRSLDAVQAKPRAMENMPGWIQRRLIPYLMKVVAGCNKISFRNYEDLRICDMYPRQRLIFSVSVTVLCVYASVNPVSTQ